MVFLSGFPFFLLVCGKPCLILRLVEYEAIVLGFSSGQLKMKFPKPQGLRQCFYNSLLEYFNVPPQVPANALYSLQLLLELMKFPVYIITSQILSVLITTAVICQLLFY